MKVGAGHETRLQPEYLMNIESCIMFAEPPKEICTDVHLVHAGYMLYLRREDPHEYEDCVTA